MRPRRQVSESEQTHRVGIDARLRVVHRRVSRAFVSFCLPLPMRTGAERSKTPRRFLEDGVAANLDVYGIRVGDGGTVGVAIGEPFCPVLQVKTSPFAAGPAGAIVEPPLCFCVRYPAKKFAQRS